MNQFTASTHAANQNLGVLGNGFSVMGQALSSVRGGVGGTLLSGVGRVFSTLIGGLFGGTSAAPTLGPGTLFNTGGYTGSGRDDEPAGIVHRNEIVWSPKDVARAGGVAVVEAMRLGKRGYQSGGVVGAANAYWPQAANSTAQAPIDNRPILQIVNNSSAQVTGDVEETTDAQGRRSYKYVLADAVGDAMATKGGKANNVLRQSGMRQRGPRR